MSRGKKVALIAASALLLVGMVFAAPASAAPLIAQADPNDEGVGGDLGDLISDLAAPIVFSFGGLAGLSAFMRRDVGQAFTVIVITLMVGLFVTPLGRGALQGVTNLISEALPSGSSGAQE